MLLQLQLGCNCDCCKCAPQLCTEPAHKLSIRRTSDVVLLRSFTLACPALLDSTWLPAASCLGLSMPHLSVLATRCVHSFFATHTLFYRRQGMGTTDKSGPLVFLNEVFYLALSSLLVIGHADKRVRVRPLVFLGGMPPIEFRVLVPAGPRILS